MTLDELYDRLGLKGDDRCLEGIEGQHILNVNAIRLQKERADKAPWVDGTDIHVGNPEGSPDGPDAWGIIGKTFAGIDAQLQKAKEDQREACAKFIEQVSLTAGRPVHAARCRAAPLVK